MSPTMSFRVYRRLLIPTQFWKSKTSEILKHLIWNFDLVVTGFSNCRYGIFRIVVTGFSELLFQELSPWHRHGIAIGNNANLTHPPAVQMAFFSRSEYDSAVSAPVWNWVCNTELIEILGVQPRKSHAPPPTIPPHQTAQTQKAIFEFCPGSRDIGPYLALGGLKLGPKIEQNFQIIFLGWNSKIAVVPLKAIR